MWVDTRKMWFGEGPCWRSKVKTESGGKNRWPVPREEYPGWRKLLSRRRHAFRQESWWGWLRHAAQGAGKGRVSLGKEEGAAGQENLWIAHREQDLSEAWNLCAGLCKTVEWLHLHLWKIAVITEPTVLQKRGLRIPRAHRLAYSFNIHSRPIFEHLLFASSTEEERKAKSNKP